MNFHTPPQKNMLSKRPTTEADRQRLVNSALSLTQDTTLAPTPYERQLLDLFVQGHLTIDHVLACLETQEYAAPQANSQEAATPQE
jgi:hypothetical protein